jgi:hypothetical protein
VKFEASVDGTGARWRTTSSAAAAALSDRKLHKTNFAAAVGWSGWFGAPTSMYPVALDLPDPTIVTEHHVELPPIGTAIEPVDE